MTLIIELEPETEERVERAAAAQGLTASEYAKRVLVDNTPEPNIAASVLTTEERLHEFSEWVASHTKYAGRPPLPDEALDRENIYEGRGL